jgi:hypothetical protein
LETVIAYGYTGNFSVTSSPSNTWNCLGPYLLFLSTEIELCYAYAPNTSSTQTWTCGTDANFSGGCFVDVFDGTLTTAAVLDSYGGVTNVGSCTTSTISAAKNNEIFVTGITNDTATGTVTYTNSLLTYFDTLPLTPGAYYSGAGGYAISESGAVPYNWTVSVGGGQVCVGALFFTTSAGSATGILPPMMGR